jgi:LAGLIDADG-like domain
LKKTKCAWCGKEISVFNLKEKNYCKRQHLGFANAVRMGAKIKQVKEELDEIKWNRKIAYLIGIIATDGTLRKNRPQIKITSKSKKYLEDLLSKIINDFTGREQEVTEYNAKFKGKKYKHYQIQFTSIPFYQFCLDIGLKPNKTTSITNLEIPDEYFSDFLRGVIDGDGNYNLDERRETTTIRIYSASEEFLKWINERCIKLFGVGGAKFHHSENDLGEKLILVFHSFYDVIKILDKIYSNNHVCYEERKNQIIDILVNLENLKKRFNVKIRIGKTVSCAYSFCNKKFTAKANEHYYCSKNCGDKQRKYPHKIRLVITCGKANCEEEFEQTTANNKYCNKHKNKQYYSICYRE